MKIRIIVILFIVGCYSLIFPASASADNDYNVVVNSTEMPSESFLQKSKRSITVSDRTASPMAGSRKGLRAENGWDDGLVFPGETEETGEGGVVGIPLGDATLPIVLSILFLYLLFRSVTTSGRKNNF